MGFCRVMGYKKGGDDVAISTGLVSLTTDQTTRPRDVEGRRGGLGGRCFCEVGELKRELHKIHYTT